MDGIDSGLDIKRLQEMKDLLHMIEHDCDLKDLEYSSEYSQEYKENNFTDLDTSALVDTNWINNDWD